MLLPALYAHICISFAYDLWVWHTLNRAISFKHPVTQPLDFPLQDGSFLVFFAESLVSNHILNVNFPQCSILRHTFLGQSYLLPQPRKHLYVESCTSMVLRSLQSSSLVSLPPWCIALCVLSFFPVTRVFGDLYPNNTYFRRLEKYKQMLTLTTGEGR